MKHLHVEGNGKSLLLYNSPRNFGSPEKILSEAIKKCLEAVLYLQSFPDEEICKEEWASCQTHNGSLGYGQKPVSLGKGSEPGWGQGVRRQDWDPGSVPELIRDGVTSRTSCSICVCRERGTEPFLMFASGTRCDYIWNAPFHPLPFFKLKLQKKGVEVNLHKMSH